MGTAHMHKQRFPSFNKKDLTLGRDNFQVLLAKPLTVIGVLDSRWTLSLIQYIRHGVDLLWRDGNRPGHALESMEHSKEMLRN
jgi:hypothetical protein